MSLQISSSPKSLHQLPAITKKPSKIVYPIIEKMKTLHNTNIRTIRKQLKQNENILQKYFVNKSQYFQTVHVKKQQSVQKVLKSLDNKSTILSKQNAQKQKKHQQLYKNFMSLNKQKVKANHLKEKAKLESALARKQVFDQSRIRNVIVKKPNYRKLYLEELGKSQQLQKTTIQRLIQAESRKNELKQQKQSMTKGKLDRSIFQAQSYVNQTESDKQRKFIQKSVNKMRQSQRLISEYRQKNRSHSETSRKSSQQKFMKAQNTRNEKQKQMIEKLQKILQQKCIKTQTINQRKEKNLQMLSTSLKKSRSQHMDEAHKKSRSLFLEADMKSEEILDQAHEKWKFLTGLKTQFNKVKNKNLYDSQQVSLRC